MIEFINIQSSVSIISSECVRLLDGFLGFGSSFGGRSRSCMSLLCFDDIAYINSIDIIVIMNINCKSSLIIIKPFLVSGITSMLQTHFQTDDTQYKHWEIYCELPKRLSLQASLYTLEPYYKDERGGEGGFEEYWRYNGKDSCVTKECSDVQGAQLKGHELGHYRFNMQMQDPLLYMELRGINYDKQESSAAANKVREEVWRLQHSLNKMVGLDLRIETPFDALKVLSEHMGFKRAQGSISNFSDLEQNCKKEFKDNGNLFRAFEMCKQGYPFDDARNGAFSMFCKRFLNTQSSDQMQAFLYGQLGLPIQFAKENQS
jgi:hypothetical protein